MTLTQTHSPAYDLQALRELFHPAQNGVTYLNHAGMSPLPRPAVEAMQHAISMMGERGVGVFPGINYAGLVQKVRANTAQLVGAQTDEVVFVPNTSTGMNLVAQSLPLNAGENVILCDVEFPSNVYPWMNLERVRGVEARLVPAKDGGMSIEAIDAARDENTRLVTVSAVQFLTGRREDLQAIGDYCHEHGLFFIVDGIQGVGITPIDMEAMHISALVAGGQKALLGPPGLGIMVLREEVMAQMQPAFVGCASVEDYERWLIYDMTPRKGAMRFDMGTPSIANLAGLDASIQLLLDLDPANILKWVSHLSDTATMDLQGRGYRVITPERHAHIVTFAVGGDADALVQALAERDIVLRAHIDAQEAPHLRLSFHAYNTEDEARAVGKALEDIL